MSAGSKGKRFEQNFKNSCNIQNILCIRLNDSSTSFIMEKNARFTPDNPCDYINFYRNYLFPIECKSTEYGSISIQLEPQEKSKMIKLHQYNSLVNFSLYEGVYPCFLFNFRQKEGVDEDTYLMYVGDFTNFLSKTDKHSINKLDIVQNGGIIVEQKLLRTNYLYNIEKAFDDMIKYRGSLEHN